MLNWFCFLQCCGSVCISSVRGGEGGAIADREPVVQCHLHRDAIRGSHLASVPGYLPGAGEWKHGP